jgi:hypothetical protein
LELNTYNLRAEEVDLLESINSKLISDHNYVLCNEKLDEFKNTLIDFELLKGSDNIDLLNVYKLKSSAQNVYLINTNAFYSWFGTKGGKHTRNDFCLIGYFETKNLLEHILIRPETIGDKVADFFTKAEIDFDSNPKFSRKYYMLSDNKELTKKNISSSFLSVIEDQDDLHVEINNNKAIATFLTNMSIEETEKIADFINRASGTI